MLIDIVFLINFWSSAFCIFGGSNNNNNITKKTLINVAQLLE